MAELGRWWTHAQQLAPEVLSAALPVSTGNAAAEVATVPMPGKPPRPRRRRRAGKPGTP